MTTTAHKQYTKTASAIYESGRPGANTGHPVTTYQNKHNGLQIVLCQIPGPMCSLEIIVPTLPTNNKGTAHALEHLVLRGSKNYPYCGYLTSFMQRNFCAGRNGATHCDHTSYVAGSIGQRAMGKLLPVYLDHVINPLLDPQQVPSQVYQENELGDKSGVVYNEMLSREAKPDDIVIYAMLKSLYPEHSPYTHYSGGYTHLLRSITHQEIVDYHAEFYDPCNITVVVMGDVTEDYIIDKVLESIPSDRFVTHGKSTHGQHCMQHRQNVAGSSQVTYPAGSGALGQVYYGWRGPSFQDELLCNAYNVLGEYLTQKASGPLSMQFARGSDPVAASISMGIFDAMPTCIYLSLRGIQASHFNLLSVDDNTIRDIIQSTLSKTQTDPGLVKGIQVAIRSVQSKYSQRFEDKPHRELAQLVRYDIVSAHWSRGQIGSSARTLSVLDQLACQDNHFWAALIGSLVQGEMHETKLIPGCKRSEAGNPVNVEHTVQEDRRSVSNWTESDDIRVPPEICEQMDIVDVPNVANIPMSVTYLSCAHSANARPFDYIQSVSYESSMARIHMQLPLADLPSDLWPYVPLFEWSLFSSNLHIPDNITCTLDPCLRPDTNGSVLETQLTNFQKNNGVEKDVRIGFTTDAFEVGWLGDYMVVTGESPAANASQMLQSILAPLFFADFSVENTLNMVRHMKAIVAHRKIDTSGLIRDISTNMLYTKTDSARRQVDIFHQQCVLEDVTRKLAFGSSCEKVTMVARLKKSTPSRQSEVLEAFASRIEDGKGGPFDALANTVRSTTNAIMSTLASGSDAEKECVLDDIYDRLAMETQSTKDSILDKLTRIKAHLLKGVGKGRVHSGIVTLGIPCGYDIDFSAKSFVAQWDALACASTCSKTAQFVSCPCPPSLLRQVHTNIPKLRGTSAVNVNANHEKSAYLRITVPCITNRYPGDFDTSDISTLLPTLPAKNHYAMVLLGHILGANEGLLSNVIRDNGIGYSPKLLYDGRMQTCTLACDKTFDVNEAFDALQTALLDISSNWTKRVDKFQLEVARSVTLFRQIKSASSPSKLLVGTAEACLEGFADLAAKHRWANEHLHAVTLDDLRHVFDTFVMQLAGTSHQSPAIAVAVTSSGDTCRVGKQELETKQLEDLFH